MSLQPSKPIWPANAPAEAPELLISLLTHSNPEPLRPHSSQNGKIQPNSDGLLKQDLPLTFQRWDGRGHLHIRRVGEGQEVRDMRFLRPLLRMPHASLHHLVFPHETMVLALVLALSHHMEKSGATRRLAHVVCLIGAKAMPKDFSNLVA
jgi:hypothetical protein